MPQKRHCKQIKLLVKKNITSYIWFHVFWPHAFWKMCLFVLSFFLSLSFLISCFSYAVTPLSCWARPYRETHQVAPCCEQLAFARAKKDCSVCWTPGRAIVLWIEIWTQDIWWDSTINLHLLSGKDYLSSWSSSYTLWIMQDLFLGCMYAWSVTQSCLVDKNKLLYMFSLYCCSLATVYVSYRNYQLHSILCSTPLNTFWLPVTGKHSVKLISELSCQLSVCNLFLSLDHVCYPYFLALLSFKWNWNTPLPVNTTD